MKRGMVIFAVATVVATWLLGLAVIMTRDALKQNAGLWLVPAMAIPLIAAYIAHQASGATGNPFKGLTWGNTSWYFLTWLAGLAVAAVAVVAGVGLGFNQIDPGMSSYIEMMAEQAAQGGAPSQPGMETGLKIVGYATAIAGPTILPWVGGAVGCLGTFPWYGWFFRRAMVGGRIAAVLIVMGLSLITSIVGGLADNPMLADVPLWVRLTVTAVNGLALVPACAWVFLRTRSAVLPSLAVASYQNGLAAAMPFTTIETPLFACPAGLVVSLFALAAGIGLWVWKDPGGEDLAVAAVAHDGTPLTPAEARALDEGEISGREPAMHPGIEPPPPTPGEIQGLPPADERPEAGNDDRDSAGGH